MKFVRWKALLAVVVIVAIVGLLYTSDTGKDYVDLLTNTLGNFVANFPLVGMQPGSEFFMELTTMKESFFGQSYKVENATLRVSGICQGTMVIGDIVMSREEKDCFIQIENLQGQFEYSAGGVVRADGKANFVTVDGYSYVPAERELSVKVEVIPVEELLLTGLSQRNIALDSVTGGIERRDEEGNIKSTEELKNEKMTIINFVGQLELEEESIILSGLTGAVRGQTFSW